MISSHGHARGASFLFLAWGFGVALGKERCRVAGAGSCTDLASQAVSSHVTGSMLQVKATSQWEELVGQQPTAGRIPQNAEGGLQLVGTASNKDVRDGETQIYDVAQHAVSDLGRLQEDAERAAPTADPGVQEQAMSDLARFQVDAEDAVAAVEQEAEHGFGDLTENAANYVGDQVQLKKHEGIEAVHGARDYMEDGLSEVELELKSLKIGAAGTMAKHRQTATAAVDSVVEAVDSGLDSAEQTVASYMPDVKLQHQLLELGEKTIGPAKDTMKQYADILKNSAVAQEKELNYLFDGASREAGTVGEEVNGLVGSGLHDLESYIDDTGSDVMGNVR